MGPKKEKKDPSKRENAVKEEKKISLEDPINTDTWRCVVIMGVEKTNLDCFLLKEFVEESSKGRRQDVSIIDYDTMIVKILNDFADGDLPYRYAFLLTFSSVFQEAVSYVEKKMDIPVILLVKIVKVLLFLYREESMMRAEKASGGPLDPIKAMAERPADFGVLDVKKKDSVKKGDNGLKVRPPSITKQDTELLKRGERAKEDQCIDDAPQNAYFSLYVLLTGFYNPDFPLELIKADIPLHAIICIDTSATSMKRDSSFIRGKFQKLNSELKSEEIQKFWEVFLKKLWNPNVSFYFKDTIFQTYMPRSLLCDKKKLREFVYREISYLMYDLSDLKRQLFNYIDHFRLWNMSESDLNDSDPHIINSSYPEYLPNDCVNVPVVLQCIIDAIIDDNWEERRGFSANSLNTESSSTWMVSTRSSTLSQQGTQEYCPERVHWSGELNDIKLLNVYLKIKELDIEYGLNSNILDNMESTASQTGKLELDVCVYKPGKCGSNMEEALLSEAIGFESFWKIHNNDVKPSFSMDYSMYALLMTRVFCLTEANVSSTPTPSFISKKGSSFEIIKNINEEIHKPHFTVTDGSRNILKSAPYNMKNTSKNFFCPEEFKIVSPGKLKASSAPEFRVTSRLKIQNLYKSEFFTDEITKNPFENLKGFVNECLFANVNDFHFLEFLNKSKLLEKELDYWNRYNCADHVYSISNDSIFLMLHNRKDSDDIHHETFNETLKTPVGLRDFYDYVLEDESEWLALQEELYQTRVILENTVLRCDSYRDFSDSYFWLKDSIKYQESNNSKYDFVKDISKDSGSTEKIHERPRFSGTFPFITEDVFEGYDISDMAVQFSGLKTVYYSKDSSVAVQLIEKLYGNQELGVHVSAGSHTLHLYSYVCPEPHVLDPFTFHVTFSNGIIVAFGRRWIEMETETEMEMDVEKPEESVTTVRSKRNASGQSLKKETVTTKDEEFFYDMSASLPNGLCVRTVRRIASPCYIKQFYISKPDNIETNRLFLPNGNIVKMMKNGTVQILHRDGSIITANTKDLVEGENKFSKFELITKEGLIKTYEHGVVVSTNRLNVFRNRDLATNKIFYRRRDGTNYMEQSDGTFVVEFSDGTKMSTSILITENSKGHSFENECAEETCEEEETREELLETDTDFGFVFVNLEIIAEHPDYATITYNGQTKNWKISLPFGSTITVNSTGNYTIDIDEETELNVEDDMIRMNKFSSEHELLSVFTADLAALDAKEGKIYCHMEDPSGKVFVVEANSNCYILKDECVEENEPVEESSAVHRKESELSEFVASADLQTCPSLRKDKSNQLTSENKYFVLRRDLTDMEVLHKDYVEKILVKLQKGSLVYTQDIPWNENRIFVLMTPKDKNKKNKWAVPSVLPNPKYIPQGGRVTSSTTYGFPPSWMHPFPKKKAKFKIPEELSCRVFMETKRTDFSPAVGTIDCYFCEVDEITEVKHSQISQDGLEKYLKKLSNEDQATLKEIYTLAAASLIYEKRKMKPVNTEKLEHYLEMSRYYVELREFHKKNIRYHIVPNYFEHPAGMSWLILNDLLLKLKFPPKKILKKRSLNEKTMESARSGKSSERSSEEIEYNLSLSAGQSFSDLSYWSDFSAESAPAILKTAGVCRCKVKGLKGYNSSPAVKCFWEETWEPCENVRFPNICDFTIPDLELLKKRREGSQKLPMSLEDLMYLGLI